MKFEQIKLSEALQQNGYIRGPFGSALKRNELKKCGIPVYEQQHVIAESREFRFYIDEAKYKELKRFTVQPNDIIISCSGTIGKASLIRESDPRGIISQALLILRCDPEIMLPQYLYFFLTSPLGFHSITSVSSGSVQVNIAKRSVIENIAIPYAPLDIQQRIVSILQCLNDKIELNHKMNANLQRQAQAVFKSWFVDFDPSGGVMPENWQLAKFGDIASVTSGRRPPVKTAEKTADACIPLVGAASVMGYTNRALYDTPILVTGRVGTHGIIQRFHSPCWPSDNTLVITSPYYEFACQVLQTAAYTNMNRGSTQPLITQTDIKNVKIVRPPDAVFEQFESFAGTLMQSWEANRVENERLSALRDTLLPRLMSGGIDIPDIAARQEEQNESPGIQRM